MSAEDAKRSEITNSIIKAVAMEHYRQGGVDAISAVVQAINGSDRDSNDRKIWSFNEFVGVLDILKQDWANAHKEMKDG
jgi:hypothetical protein